MQNRNTYRRKNSLRLNDYDYSNEGLYFVTLVAHQRKHLFGEIENGILKQNPGGIIASSCWLEIPKHYPQVILHEYIVMPNHVHGILEISSQSASSVRAENIPPQPEDEISPSIETSVDAVRAEDIPPQRRRPSLSNIIKGYKIGVTNWYRQNTDIEKIWQRSFHDHIIRNYESYERIRNYIIDNPNRWDTDKFKTEN